MSNLPAPVEGVPAGSMQAQFVRTYTGDLEADAQRLSLPVSLLERWTETLWFKDALRRSRKQARLSEVREEVLTRENVVLDKDQLETLWSHVATSQGVKTADKLKASEMLARSRGVFQDKVTVENVDAPRVNPIDLRERMDVITSAKVTDVEVISKKALASSPPGREDWLDE